MVGKVNVFMPKEAGDCERYLMFLFSNFLPCPVGTSFVKGRFNPTSEVLSRSKKISMKGSLFKLLVDNFSIFCTAESMG